MSVEEKLIRLAPPAFESLQEHPSTLIDIIEELYALAIICLHAARRLGFFPITQFLDPRYILR